MKKIIGMFLTLVVLIATPQIVDAAYYVKPGDSLWKISQQYKMNYRDLLNLNPQLSNPSRIDVGQKINVRSSHLAQDIIDYAVSLQDVTDYKLGADYSLSPRTADCSSWTKHIYEKFGIWLPRVSWQQASHVGTPVPFYDENKNLALKKGDLMFFGDNGRVSHVGIYMGDGYWISNLNSEKDVVILSIWGSWSYDRFLWAQRVI
ncbi:peptidase [Paraliobacillus quinghaiensis]|uniref:Peptidase n=1 Tax=Paraliobacillus quinghaiensis TaxID=470815 RepID=A0A917WYS8_9BACI|nr:LysM peptidoglycan-binding domain-containing protein [Paraliobacillus quinghaiensis]GGM41421.1 peptidase [Paraliobacillus quinghaiensis]